MTKRQRQIAAYLCATDEERKNNQYAGCEFQDAGFNPPSANEIKQFVTDLSAAELRRLQDGPNGAQFLRTANAALTSLVPKRPVRVHKVQVSIGSKD